MGFCVKVRTSELGPQYYQIHASCTFFGSSAREEHCVQPVQAEKADESRIRHPALQWTDIERVLTRLAPVPLKQAL